MGAVVPFCQRDAVDAGKIGGLLRAALGKALNPKTRVDWGCEEIFLSVISEVLFSP